MSKQKLIIIWVIWLIVFPAGFWLSLKISPPVNMSFWDVFAFTVMACVIACIPIVINNTTIFLSHWVSLAAFLSYGLFFEVAIIQLATVSVLITIKLPRQEFYRFFINSSMMMLTSLAAGIGFFLAGGEVGSLSLEKLIIPVLVYQFFSFVTNQLVLYAVDRFLKRPVNIFGQDFIWEALLLLVVFPLGLVLYFLNEYMGIVSVILLGVPFLTFVLILRLYNSSEKVNNSLQKAAEIGHELTERLDIDEVLDLFIQKISQTLPVDYAAILDVQKDKLMMLRQMDKKDGKVYDYEPVKKGEGLSGVVWETGKGVIFSQRKEWVKEAVWDAPIEAESVMCVPIFRSQKVEGVLLLASSKKRAYEKFQLMIVDILCSYFSVALMNARHYEEKKKESEICALTKVYNYRYFDKLVSEQFGMIEAGVIDSISLVMLDIDHFKRVNDTYGHQAGNEILIKLANRLKDKINGQGTLARYGGEEFVILLPGIEKELAYQLAESIRRTIVDTPFVVQNELDPEQSLAEVQITVSIGVSSTPDDADDPMSLVRHADRALYIGAKRAGRNRVATYVK